MRCDTTVNCFFELYSAICRPKQTLNYNPTHSICRDALPASLFEHVKMMQQPSDLAAAQTSRGLHMPSNRCLDLQILPETRPDVQLAAEAERASPPHPAGSAVLEAASRLQHGGSPEDNETPTAPRTSEICCLYAMFRAVLPSVMSPCRRIG